MLTDEELLEIACIVKYSLGEECMLYWGPYSTRFEKEVGVYMRNGMNFKDACIVVCSEWGWRY